MADRNTIETYLNDLTAEERELTLAADDALDCLYAYRLSKEYGVEVVCNPDGDRSKIQIDGVAMNRQEFADWLCNKEAEKAMGARRSAASQELPTRVEISYDDVTYPGIASYLRNAYDHYLSGNDHPNMQVSCDNDRCVYVVTGIKWGRKR